MVQKKQPVQMHAASMKWSLNPSLALANFSKSLVTHILSRLNFN